MSSTVTVRAGVKADLVGLSQTLALAFHEDPVMTWLWPDAEKRATGVARLFSALTHFHHLSGGGVQVAVDDAGVIGGAALWDPPGRWRHSLWSDVCMLPALIRAFGSRIRVGKSVTDTLARHHLAEPHWYLATIGTDPRTRGTGFGRELMHSRLELCDAQQIPAYLESTAPDNVPYYERFGFVVTGEISLPDGGPTLWAMRRGPVRPV
ncbi:GNAT family N-acetyltransferase [Nocardia sp. NBC_00565]|uniref:GNAT family N-acetyltransferase n=1 Tax=Nocardia sp. NBC_00565 TaxID=2975993 RepID=UPI002E81C968|nr:GNAT family N-acetyltransferase [Nocardia sp. NBC_00565]WUC07410.1 GNAT family N-acetyltransferase [Nocardia sp. NBC_00565]